MILSSCVALTCSRPESSQFGQAKGWLYLLPLSPRAHEHTTPSPGKWRKGPPQRAGGELLDPSSHTISSCLFEKRRTGQGVASQHGFPKAVLPQRGVLRRGTGLQFRSRGAGLPSRLFLLFRTSDGIRSGKTVAKHQRRKATLVPVCPGSRRRILHCIR